MDRPLFHIFILSFSLLIFNLFSLSSLGQSFSENSVIKLGKTRNFSFQENKIADAWTKIQWTNLSQIKGDKKEGYYTRIKALYSSTGLYFLFEAGDKLLNAHFQSDFEKLWTQDVVEVFIWPDTTVTDYFEYELSPLNYELPLLISQIDKKGHSNKWIPFLYESSYMKTRHETLIKGGERGSGAAIKKWIAKIFIPYKLLSPLQNISPKKGTQWKINFYRIDYDQHKTKWWAWQPVHKSFHEYKKFGTLLFTE